MCECTNFLARLTFINFLARLTFMIVASFGWALTVFLRIVTSGYDKKKNLRKTWFFVQFWRPCKLSSLEKKHWPILTNLITNGYDIFSWSKY
jgi:hypothetical protein